MSTLVQEKVQQATKILEEQQVDLWLTFVRETSAGGDPILPIIYGEGGLTWHSALLISKTGRHTAIVGKFEAHAARETGAYSDVIPYDQSIQPALVDTIKRLDPATIAVNTSLNDVMADGLTHGMYTTLQNILKATPYLDRIISSENIIGALRGRKTKAEIERVRQAVRSTEEIYKNTFERIHLGMSEREVACIMHEQLIARGLGSAWSWEGCPIINAGPESPVGHGAPGDLTIRPGQILHFDFGVRQDEYCSDIQRLVYFLAQGETQPPDQVKHGFETIVQAIQAVVNHMRPGATGFEMDLIARQYVIEAGYPEFMYATGHQLGRTAHDGGTLLGPRWDRYGDSPYGKLESGQIYTVEPGLSLPGYGYIGIEEDVLVTETGAEFITTPQVELVLK